MQSPVKRRPRRAQSAASRAYARRLPQFESVEERVVLSTLTASVAALAPSNLLATTGAQTADDNVLTMSAPSVTASSLTAPADSASFDPSTGLIHYTLAEPATVSAGVYNASGQLVRTLFSMQADSAGRYATQWDGNNDLGQAVPSGSYSVKLVINRNTYTNVGAIGQSVTNPSTADHVPTGIDSVAVDSTGAIYTADGWDEAGADFKKWAPDGSSVYDAQFQIRNGDPNGAPYRVATDGTYMYFAVGAWSGQQLIERFKLSDGAPAPFSGSNLVAGHIQVYDSVSNLVTASTPAADVPLMTSPLQSLAVSGNVLYVADAAGNRVLSFDKNTGGPLGQFSVSLPQALAVDSAGRIWVGHDHGTISVFSPDGTFVGDAATGLSNVVALAFGPTGQLYAADSGAGQVRVLNVSGTTATLSWTLGQPAQPGDSNPSHFFDLTGVAVDSSGNIITVQNDPVSGASLTKWSSTGTLIWNQFSNEFVSLGNYGQDHPDQFYSMTFHAYELTDPSSGAWDYVGDTAPTSTSYSSNPHGVPRVLTLGGNDFYFDPTGDGMQVYRIEGSAFHLAALVGGDDPAPDATMRTEPIGEWTWSDLNGTGQPAPTELNWFEQPGQGTYRTMGMDVDRHGNIWFADETTGGIWEIPLQSLDVRGNPVYNWAQAREVVGKDTSSFGFQPQMVQHADDGSTYALGFSTPWPSGGTELWMGGTTLVKYDASGNKLWAVELPEVCTGMDTIPSGGGVMLGGGKSDTIYQYTSDGLRIGSMSPGAPLAGISGWLDNNASVAVSRDPRDGMLDVFTEDDYGLHIGWYRIDDQNATTLTVALNAAGSTPVSSPAPTPQAPVPVAQTAPPPTLPATPPPPVVSTPATPLPTPIPTPSSSSSDVTHGNPVAPAPAPTPAATLRTPAAPILLASDDTGAINDDVTTVRRPHFVGTTAPGAVVELVDGQGRILGIATASFTDGSFAIQPAANLPVGKLALRYRVIDPASHRSLTGPALMVDIVKPAAPLHAASAAAPVGFVKTVRAHRAQTKTPHVAAPRAATRALARRK